MEFGQPFRRHPADFGTVRSSVTLKYCADFSAQTGGKLRYAIEYAAGVDGALAAVRPCISAAFCAIRVSCTRCVDSSSCTKQGRIHA